MKALNTGLSKIRSCNESYQLVSKLAGKDKSEALKEASETVKKQLDKLSDKLFVDETVQGIYEPTDALSEKLSGTWSITMSNKPLTENQLHKLTLYLSAADEALEEINSFMESEWAVFRKVVESEEISLFK